MISALLTVAILRINCQTRLVFILSASTPALIGCQLKMRQSGWIITCIAKGGQSVMQLRWQTLRYPSVKYFSTIFYSFLIDFWWLLNETELVSTLYFDFRVLFIINYSNSLSFQISMHCIQTSMGFSVFTPCLRHTHIINSMVYRYNYKMTQLVFMYRYWRGK